jgi:hypothetical protein
VTRKNIKYLKNGTVVYVHEKLDSGYIVSYAQFNRDYEPNFVIEKCRFFVKAVYDDYK